MNLNEIIFVSDMTFEDFILLHESDDLTRLLLSRKQYPEVDVSLAVSTIESRRKLKKKVPEWYAVPGLVLPFPLSAEQCSSSATARYKSELVQRLAGPKGKVADLTGGLGVDAAAFASISSEVLYNEMSPELCEAVRKNFSLLEIHNIRFSCQKIEKGALESVLGGFEPDVLFLDPARRDAASRKVFLLEDCSPDITGLQDEFLAACRFVLVKISPLADISIILRTLRNIKEIHIVEADGECKELLLLMDRDSSGDSPLVTVASLRDNRSLSFFYGEESGAEAKFVEKTDSLSGLLLFEPGKALMKSGAFKLISSRYGLQKLDRHTHLYAAKKIPEALHGFGKVYSIIETASAGRQSFRDFGRKYPQAEVTARNVPMSSDELRKKLGCSSGGSIHIFCTTAASEKLLLAATTLPGARR